MLNVWFYGVLVFILVFLVCEKVFLYLVEGLLVCYKVFSNILKLIMVRYFYLGLCFVYNVYIDFLFSLLIWSKKGYWGLSLKYMVVLSGLNVFFVVYKVMYYEVGL